MSSIYLTGKSKSIYWVPLLYTTTNVMSLMTFQHAQESIWYSEVQSTRDWGEGWQSMLLVAGLKVCNSSPINWVQIKNVQNDNEETS